MDRCHANVRGLGVGPLWLGPLQVGEIEKSYEEGTLPQALIDVGHHSEHLSIVYQEQVRPQNMRPLHSHMVGYSRVLA